jgi:hypothetical protein
MNAQFLHKLALARNAVDIPDQQHAQQEFGLDRASDGLAVSVFQLLLHKLKLTLLIDEPQQMVFRNLIFETELIKQRF